MPINSLLILRVLITLMKATLYTVDLFNDDLTLETSIPEDGVSVSAELLEGPLCT